MEARLCLQPRLPLNIPQRRHCATLETDLRISICHLEFSSINSAPATSSICSLKWRIRASKHGSRSLSSHKGLSVLERAFIGASAGAIAGAFTHVCLHPLDTIKTRLQTRGASLIYRNSFDVVVKVFKEKGFLGFYRGLSAVFVGSAISSAVYFGTCEFGRSLFLKLGFPPFFIPPISGALGNLVSSAILVPKDVVTQRMQLGFKGTPLTVLLSIVEEDGVPGLYVGWSATLLRNLPAGVLGYSAFEYLKSALLTVDKERLKPIEIASCGAVAGIITAAITTPLDVVKTRMMTQETVNRAAAVACGGLLAAVRRILAEEGWLGFARGIGPRMVYSACFSAIGYFAFETTKAALFRRYLNHKEIHAAY